MNYKVITRVEAETMYEQHQFYEFMPFESQIEDDFITYLADQGYEVIDDEFFQIVEAY